MELYRQAAEQGQLADPEKFSTAVLTLLRTKTPEQLSTLRGAGEGLENRLYAAAREAETVNDLYDRLKTKRYPTARLRRLVLDAVLDVPAAGLPALPPYLLVLGAKRSALPLLKHAKIPAGTSLAGTTCHRRSQPVSGLQKAALPAGVPHPDQYPRSDPPVESQQAGRSRPQGGNCAVLP